MLIWQHLSRGVVRVSLEVLDEINDCAGLPDDGSGELHNECDGHGESPRRKKARESAPSRTPYDVAGAGATMIVMITLVGGFGVPGGGGVGGVGGVGNDGVYEKILL